jgi:phosphoglucosamine mutase
VSGERRYFGTDGVRGIVGRGLDEALVHRLGHAFAEWAGGASVLIGRDTRASGPALEAALAGGLAAGGAAVRSGGVLPTPAVALVADECGAVVSASHNPPEYNGVKFFDAEGFKLSDAAEAEIEALMETRPATAPPSRAPEHDPALRDRYVDLVLERFGGPLAGISIVCDCANGAMSELAPSAFERLGAKVTSVGNEPDGRNINEGCGATDLRLLARVVRGGEFELGVAFDGDGDRMLAVDGDGREIDGDGILAILALRLGVDLVVVTEMTNLGFHRLMAERGVRVVTTAVGDRYVLEAMRREGGRLGGEQSGHIVLLDGHTAGDGLAAALLLARTVAESGEPLAALARGLDRLPQAKRNLRVARRELTPSLAAEIERVNAALDGGGRVLVRPSGTEPVVRVLAEAESEEAAEGLCASIAALVERELA